MEAFGLHLTLDGYNCNYQKITDLDLIYSFLDEGPDIIGMTKIMPPYVFKYSGKVPEDWGLSGFVLIAESHISIHTFPEKTYLSLDIFSCKLFDTLKITDYIKNLFNIGHYESNLLDRGLEFPRNPKTVEEILTKERGKMVVGGLK